MQSSRLRPRAPWVLSGCLVGALGLLAGCGGADSATPTASHPTATNTAPGAVVTTLAAVAGPQTPSCETEQGRRGKFTAVAEFPKGDKGAAEVVLSGPASIEIGDAHDSTPGDWSETGTGTSTVMFTNTAVRGGGGRLTLKGTSDAVVRCTAVRH